MEDGSQGGVSELESLVAKLEAGQISDEEAMRLSSLVSEEADARVSTIKDEQERTHENSINFLKRVYSPEVAESEAAYSMVRCTELKAIMADAESMTMTTSEASLRVQDMDLSRVEQDYWGLHTPEYLAQIGELSKGMHTIDWPSKKGVVCLAAMNETNLEDWYSNVKTSIETGGDSMDDYVVFVFHNYKGEYGDIDASVLESVNAIKDKDDVSVVEAKMPSDGNVRLAKKMASDIVLKASEGHDLPLIFTDADIEEYQGGLIPDSVNMLHSSSSEGIYAVTAQYKFSEMCRAEYPVLSKYFEVQEYIYDAQNKSGKLHPMTVGGYTVIDKKIFQAVGGWGLSLEPIPEDMRLTYQLTDAFTSIYSSIEDYYPVKATDGSESVLMYPSREIQSVNRGKTPQDRYLGGYEQVSGTLRRETRGMSEASSDLLRQGVISAPEQVAIGVNQYLAEMRLRRKSLSADNNNILLRYLHEQGIGNVVIEDVTGDRASASVSDLYSGRLPLTGGKIVEVG